MPLSSLEVDRLGEYVADFIHDLKPDEIFTTEELEEWAKDNDFVKKGEEE